MPLTRRKVEELRRSLLEPEPEEFVDTRIQTLKHLIKDDRPNHLTEGHPPFCEKLKNGMETLAIESMTMLIEEQKEKKPLLRKGYIASVVLDSMRKLVKQLVNTNPENYDEIDEFLDRADFLFNIIDKKKTF